MTNLFTQSFDFLNNTLAAQFWSTIGSGSTYGNAGSARNGAAGLLLGGNAQAKQFAVADEHATLTIGLAFRRGSSGTLEIRFLSDSLATQHVTIQITGTGEIKAFRGTVAGTQLGTTVAAGTYPSGVWKYIEAKVTLSDTVGTVEVRIDGSSTPVINLSSQDTKNAGTKTVFDGFSILAVSATGDVDDLYVNNGAGANNTSFMGDVKIVSGLPNANGTTSGLTGSDGNSTDNYLLVDESPANTSDYNGSDVNDTLDTYNYANFAATGDTILTVNVYDYSAKSDAGARSGAVVVRSGGTNFEQATHSLATGYQYYTTRLPLDPNTSAAWTVANLNAAEFGFKVKA